MRQHFRGALIAAVVGAVLVFSRGLCHIAKRNMSRIGRFIGAHAATTAPRRVGVKTIEFTPNETGVIPWICWMGMLHRHFEVIADTETGSPS